MSWHFDVPEHWKVVPIETVVFFQEGPGVRSYQYTNSGVKLLNGGNINDGTLNLDTTERHIAKEEAYGKYEHFLVDEGDLLIACSGVVVDKFDGKIAYAKKQDLPLCMNTSTMRFKSLNSDVLYIDYFRRFLATKYFKNQLQKLITGSAQLNFGPSHIKQMTIPLPPLAEQKRIAAILDKADSLRRKRQQALQLADEFLRAVFLDMFGDPVTNPKGWERCKFENLVDMVTYGLTVRPEYHEEGIPLISAREIKSGEINFNDSPKISDSDFAKLSKKGLPNFQDILFSKTGSIGHCAIVESNTKFAVTQNAARIVPNTEKCEPLFLLSLLRTKYFFDLANREAKGNAVKDLQLGIMKEFPVYAPPLDIQKQYVEIFKRCKNLKYINFETEINVNNLFNSLSQKAFAGEL